MRDVREIIGNLKSTIKTKSRKGYQAIANTASRLRSSTGHLSERLRRISTRGKSRQT
jgi:hypothetical protein